MSQVPETFGKPLPRNPNGGFEETFVANGNKYRIMPSGDLPLGRYKYYGPLSAAVGFGASFSDLYSKVDDLARALDRAATGKGSFVEAAAIAHNLRLQLSNAAKEDRMDPAIELCAVFVLREGENPYDYDEVIAKEKINDWRKEGYQATDFFLLALGSIAGWADMFKDLKGHAPSKPKAKPPAPEAKKQE